MVEVKRDMDLDFLTKKSLSTFILITNLGLYQQFFIVCYDTILT